MAGRKLTVVVSQAPGKNPVKRHLEEEIATRLMLSGLAEVSVVPHLYDLTGDHTGMLWLRSLKGDLVVLSWLFPRAIRWTLDRNGVKGQIGDSRLNKGEEDESDDEDVPADSSAEDDGRPSAIGSLNPPKRLIYAIDLRDHSDPETYITEIERINSVVSVPLVQLSLLGGRSLNFEPLSILDIEAASSSRTPVEWAPRPSELPSSEMPPSNSPVVISGDDVKRRWYPVIDYSRCTNCMECIDFCLFGVYGVDLVDRILVEQQDNCKKGCPACSRVCPVNAIVFPEHKTPGIAGAEGSTTTDFKIDLSKLFGAPNALDMAVLERDTELVADGREAVGVSVGIPKRQNGLSSKPRDSLDDLMDGLDSLDL